MDINVSSSLSPSSLHQLITICSIKLKPSNYLVWRTSILQLIMQTLKVTAIITDEAPSETIEDAAGEPTPNPKFAEWEERDVLVRHKYGRVLRIPTYNYKPEDADEPHSKSTVAFVAQKSQGRGRGNYYRGRGNRGSMPDLWNK
ncbi:hypothetical protein CQW23_21384 [Capsicum baccatum]|uniref:Retrotransposon Copia-like N-terminal domain-containing protein n=1 Tax=Capsicum baccatum TaxID=33114 RepID=A0A2G2VXX1_CAPBA|nr:hypothetical protein CQW23_21384 [Capsicum baccatum]